MFWNRDGQPVDLRTFLRLQADTSYRILRREVVGEYEVITAWLGLDQALGDEVRPLIFGTAALVAGTDAMLFEGREWFAASEPEALENHVALVARLRQRPTEA